MSLANWTTRVLAGPAHGGERQPDAQEGAAHREAADGASLAPAAPRSWIGSRVGTYLITRRLGRGGVGEVFKGVDEMLKREVAIKVLRRELACDPLFVERFRREAQIHAKLSHPNVATVHAFLQEGDTLFLVMEYVAGISLDDFVRAGGPVPPARALGIFRRALDGIEHAHQCGIVHRDIKPANIMLADCGLVKVMDFGIAHALDCHEHLTRHGQVAGTAKSMSPEQIRGGQADVRSDIYSLGIVLYTLLAGHAPFEADDDHALMKAQLEQAPTPLRDAVEHLPPAVEAAVMRALQKDPSARFQTVGEFARALDACLAELEPPASPQADPPELLSACTVVNHELGDAMERPAAGPAKAPGSAGRARRLAAGARAAMRRWHPARTLGALPPWVSGGAVVLALGPMVTATVLAWPHLTAWKASSVDGVMAAHGEQHAAVVPDAMAAVGVPPPAQASATAAVASPRPAQPSAAAAETPSLTIVRLPTGGTAPPASESRHRFQAGERIRLRITPSHAAHVYCYLEDEARRIVRFYPNRFSASALVSPSAPLEIPGAMRFELVANHLRTTETVACFASARDLTGRLPAAVVGTDFASLPATSLDEVRSAFARVAPDALAQARFVVELE